MSLVNQNLSNMSKIKLDVNSENVTLIKLVLILLTGRLSKVTVRVSVD